MASLFASCDTIPHCSLFCCPPKPPTSLPSVKIQSFPKPTPSLSFKIQFSPIPTSSVAYNIHSSLSHDHHCSIPDRCYVRIFDTTLCECRDLTMTEKLEVARQLCQLHVDAIGVGFPASSRDDFEAVTTIAKDIGNGIENHGYVPIITGLSRCNKDDIDRVWHAIQFAKLPRIHLSIPRDFVMKNMEKTREEVLQMIRENVAYARSLCEDVEFAAEDATRADPEFLYLILAEAIKAGATTVDIPDTVGMALYHEFGQLIADIQANSPGIDNVIISTHCHNDLGMATANTLAGICAGARQAQVTVNGIGERAGVASLEKVVNCIQSRGREEMGGYFTGINTRYIVMTSQMVARCTEIPVRPQKAIVRANASGHESGIQTASDDHPEVLVSNGASQPQAMWKICDVQVTCGNFGHSTATVTLIDANGVEHIDCAAGKGPVAAAYRAIDCIVKEPVTLKVLELNSINKGTDATVAAYVVICKENSITSIDASARKAENICCTFSATGAGMDILVACVRAYVSALNKMLSFRNPSV